MPKAQISKLVLEIQNAVANKRKPLLMIYLQNRVRKVLGLESDVVIDVNKPLMELGLDSLLSVELRNILKQDFGDSLTEPLTTTLMFNYPTVEAMSNYFSEQLFGASEPTDEIKQPIVNYNAVVNKLSNLSREELNEKALKILKDMGGSEEEGHE